MIGKITTGASGRALIGYLFGPGKANEHTDQRVITSGLALGGDVLAVGALSSQAIVELGSDLDAANDLARADPAGGHIWHLSLSLPAGDRPLTDHQWADGPQDHTGDRLRAGGPGAVRLGGGRPRGECTRQSAHPHRRLPRSTRWQRVETWQSKRTISRVCAEVEHTHGLTIVEGRAGRGMPGLTRAGLECTAREQLAEPPRIALARMVREASVSSKDEAGVRPPTAGQRGETEMAIALVEHLEGELVSLHDQFGRSRDERLVPDVQRVWAYDGSREIEALDCGVVLDTHLDLDLDGEFDCER